MLHLILSETVAIASRRHRKCYYIWYHYTFLDLGPAQGSTGILNENKEH